jgi:hypothetical protein
MHMILGVTWCDWTKKRCHYGTPGLTTFIPFHEEKHGVRAPVKSSNEIPVRMAGDCSPWKHINEACSLQDHGKQNIKL